MSNHVVLRWHDRDYDHDRAGEHPFNANGRAYGVAVYHVDSYRFEARLKSGGSDPLHVEYAPSEGAAMHNARLWAKEHGYEVVG